MKKLLILSLIIIPALGQRGDNFDFRFPNGVIIQACVGDDVSFPWVLNRTSPHWKDINWVWNYEDIKKRVVLASYSDNDFFKQQYKWDWDVEFLPDAGIKVFNVKLADAGPYTVLIDFTEPEHSTVRFTQTAFLIVFDFVFEWKSSSEFPDGTVVQAYVGEDVVFPWMFYTTSPYPVLIQWNWNNEEGNKRLVLASYSENTFNKVVPKRDLGFLPNAALVLPKVTFADAGLYSIDIEMDGCLHPKRYTQAALLRVSEKIP